MFYCK